MWGMGQAEQETFQGIQPQVFASRPPGGSRLFSQVQESLPGDRRLRRSANLFPPRAGQSTAEVLTDQLSQQNLQRMQDSWPRCGKGLSNAHQFGWLATTSQPAPQRLIRDVRSDFVPEPECVNDAAGSVVQAESMRFIRLDRIASDIEGGGIEFVPVHRGRHARLPHSARQRNLVRGWDNVSQLVPCQGRYQTQSWPMRLHRYFYEVVVNGFFIGAPVEPAPDPLGQARRKHPLKPTPGNPVALRFRGRERSRKIIICAHPAS
jgi:hypothetical protein